jgi:SHS2 domain-containing protein
MAYAWGDHVGELELAIEAPSREAVFADGVRALGELLGDGGAGETRELAVEGADLASLLAAWLEELVFLAETEDFVPEALASVALRGSELRAVVAGRRGRPSHLVKAVTYHGLAVEERADGWHARVVLDV